MTGIIDVGGGMRGVYTSGIYDYLLDHGVNADYCIGVSAGSANLMTYLAGQKGRSKRFYTKYSRRKEYMGLRTFLRRGSFFDLDYIYSALSNSDGEDPIDYDAFQANPARFVVVATQATSGRPRYFTREDVTRDNYDIIKASSALPAASRPYRVGGVPYFDGGVSDPVPYKKAMADGCDRLLVLLTRPRDFVRPPLSHPAALRTALRRYPATMAALSHRHERYNRAVAAIKEMEREGKALLLAPADIEGIDTLRRNSMAMERLYGYGIQDGEKAAAFLTGQ